MAKSKEQKKQEATNREKLRNSVTAAQKLEYLDVKFGKGQGATKERVKLKKLVDSAAGMRDDIVQEILAESESGKKFKVKKGQDPLKEKKKARREAKRVNNDI